VPQQLKWKEQMLRRTRYQPPKPIKPWEGPKPKLSMEVSLTCRVHFKDLQDYLFLVYKLRGYDIQQAVGAGRLMTPEFIVTGDMPNTPNLWQQIDNIRRGRSERNLGLILNLLCKDGFIPKGKYVIDMTPGPSPLDSYRDALHKTSDPLSVECLKIKETNKGDRDFVKAAAMLDKRVAEYQSKLKGASSE